MGQPITILGTTAIWPTTGDTGYSADALQIIQLLDKASEPIEGLYNTTTGQVGNLALDDAGNLTLNGEPIAGGGTGSVTSVAIASQADLQVSGSPITTSGTIDINLAPTGVTAGSYTRANITVDTKGRITSASNGVITGTVSSVSASGLQGVTTAVLNPTTTPAIQIGLGAITPTSVTTTGTVTASNISGTNTGNQTITLTGDAAGVSIGAPATSLPINLLTTGVTPGTYTHATITVDSKGRISSASNGVVTNGTVTSVSASGSNGVTISGSPITSSGTIAVGLGAITPTSVTTSGAISAGSISSSGNISAVGTVTGSNISGTSSGTNTGNQTITATGDVTGVSSGAPATSLPLTLSNTTVVPGTYIAANITVDAKGRITAASAGNQGVWGQITGDITAQTDLNEVFTMIGNVTIGTGVTTYADTVGLIALNDTTVRLKATTQAVFSSLISSGLSNADRTFPQQDYPLANLVFPGDGIYVRFIGVDTNSIVVTSPASFKTSPNVLQYGYMLVKQVGGVKTFLDGAAGQRNVFTWPDYAGNNAAESEYFTPSTNIVINPNANLTVKNNTGVIKGLNINWGTANVNTRAIASQNPTSFITINPATALAASLPAPGTAVQVTQYWDGTAMVALGGPNVSSVQRFFVTIAGGLFLQVGEVAYANFATAIDNISVAPFTDIVPPESFIEIVRFASRSGSTNLSLNADAVFASGQGGSGGGGGDSAGTVTSVNVTGAQGVTAVGGPITSTGSITVGLGAITPTSVAATGTVTGTNISGTNTGDQTITLTGDVTGSGTASFPATLANTTVVPGSYTSSNITVDSKGRITAASSNTVSAVAGANTQIQFNNSGVFGASANLTFDGSKVSLAGDLAFTGNNRTISGSMSTFDPLAGFRFRGIGNTGGTYVNISSNATGQGAGLFVNENDTANTSRFIVGIDQTAMYLTSQPRGTGTNLPIFISSNGTPQITTFPSGSVKVGYGTGAGPTDGYLYIPTILGTPTGTPTSLSGPAPITIDNNTGHIWTYAAGRWHNPKIIEQVIATTDYTTTQYDAGKQIFHPATDTTARTFTVSAFNYPIGTEILFVNDYGAGVVTLTCGNTLFWTDDATIGSKNILPGNSAIARKVGDYYWQVTPNKYTTSGTVTSVGIASTTLTTANSPITSNGDITVDLPAQSSEGSYTSANITVDGFGRVTAASNGGGGGLEIFDVTSSSASYNLLLTDAVSGNITTGSVSQLTFTPNGMEGATLRVGGTGNLYGLVTVPDATSFTTPTLTVRSGNTQYGTGGILSLRGGSSDSMGDGGHVDILAGGAGGGIGGNVYISAGYGVNGLGSVDINARASFNLKRGNPPENVLTVNGITGSWGIGSSANFGNPGQVLTTNGNSEPSWADPTIVRQTLQSSSYTCVFLDAGKHILHPSADTTARVFTIPSNASVPYTIGTTLMFVNQNAAGVITIAITTDTMRLAGPGTTGNRTLAANGIATALKITETEWIINGTGLT